MTRRIYRYTVPVDDKVHAITMQGPVLHVGSRLRATVEFWAEYDDTRPSVTKHFTVVGTGQPLDGDITGYFYIGTAYDGGYHNLVWHLLEIV